MKVLKKLKKDAYSIQELASHHLVDGVIQPFYIRIADDAIAEVLAEYPAENEDMAGEVLKVMYFCYHEAPADRVSHDTDDESVSAYVINERGMRGWYRSSEDDAMLIPSVHRKAWFPADKP